ncbi:MAG: hypothetical protein AAGD01_20860 [Acidobacteriota bacterium]
MDWLNVGLGAAAILYALYTAVLRQRSPGSFGKLDRMKETWGETAGHVVHFISYTLIPFGFGAIALYAGINGRSIF